MRQSDIVFSAMLTEIGDGSPLNQSEVQLIGSRFRSEQWCDENFKEAVRLYHRNHSVDLYNKKATQDGLEHIAKDTITGYSSFEQLS